MKVEGSPGCAPGGSGRMARCVNGIDVQPINLWPERAVIPFGQLHLFVIAARIARAIV